MFSRFSRARIVNRILLTAGTGWLGVACASSSSGTTPTPTVSLVSVTPTAQSISAGSSVQLTATVKDASGATLSGQSVTWSSSTPGIASVSSAGLVTGVAPGGPVTISATASGVIGTASVTVTQVPVAQVTVAPASSSIIAGTMVQLAATTKDAGGNVLASRVVTWLSSNPAIALVSATGLVTGTTAGGPLTITATSEGVSGTSSITIVALVYDAVNNISWLANTDLPATNPFGLPTCPVSGAQSCVNPSGSMNYQSALAWVAAMNAATYLGHTNWQLPTNPTLDGGCGRTGPNGNNFGFNCAASAMGYLYYTILGLKAPNTAVAIPSNTVGPFSNIQPYLYWSQSSSPAPAPAVSLFRSPRAGRAPTRYRIFCMRCR